MESIGKWLQLVLDVAGVVGVVIGGVFAFSTVFDAGRRKRQADADAIDSRVIAGLKEEMTLQSGTITRMEGDLRELRDSNLKLASENKTLREILQGRDDATIKYQAEGKVAMEQIKGIAEVTKASAVSVERLATAIEAFVTKETTLEGHMTMHTTPTPTA